MLTNQPIQAEARKPALARMTRTVSHVSMPRALGAALLFVLLYGQALAQTISNFQSMPIFFTCLAQDQASANAFWSSVHVPNSTAQEARQRVAPMVEHSSWAACVRRKQWVSRDLCGDILDAYKVERGLDLRPVMSKHQSELRKLTSMYEYFEGAFPNGGVERPNAPPCPE